MWIVSLYMHLLNVLSQLMGTGLQTPMETSHTMPALELEYRTGLPLPINMQLMRIRLVKMGARVWLSMEVLLEEPGIRGRLP